MAPKNKWTITLHDQVEDPYYTISNGPITLAANCGFVGETNEEEDVIFNTVADALNASDIDFHSENKLELQQHIEIQRLRYALEDISRQKTCAEIEADEEIPIGSDGSRIGDIYMGYDCIIDVARKALNYNTKQWHDRKQQPIG